MEDSWTNEQFEKTKQSVSLAKSMLLKDDLSSMEYDESGQLKNLDFDNSEYL